MRTTVALVGAVAVFAAGVAVGASGTGSGTGPGTGGSGVPLVGPGVDDGAVALPAGLELAGALTSFPGCEPFLEHVRTHALEQVTPYGLGGGPGGGWPTLDGSRGFAAATDDAAGGDAPASGNVVADREAAPLPDGVSGTNVQEAGVDEPDRVKTDGDTLYVVTGDRLRIVDLTGDEPEQLAEVRLSGGGGAELLLVGDRLLVTSGGGGFVPFPGERGRDAFLPGASGMTTVLSVVDVSDRSAPEVTERLVLDGATLSSRLVDGIARVVIRTEAGTNLPWEHPEAGGLRAEQAALAANEALIRGSDAEDWLPYVVHQTADGERSEGTLVPCERVARPDAFAGLGSLSVLTVDVADGSLLPDRSAVAILAGGDTVYASADRLYVATQRWEEQGWWRGGGGGAWSTAEPADDLAIEPRFPEPDDDRTPEVTTELHAFAIDDPNTTEYLGSGSVDGTLLSQWALSEHEGVLRVASTIGDPWSARSSSSSVTTLELEDGALVELGRVDGLGPTETIHAVRFIGEVGYVVTFRQVDPLYTVDLSDPATPEVVGELKIPGYSAYLHPVGDGRLLGVGQDADEGTGMTEGVQVSLFDVSDPADPRRTDTVTVPRSSSSVEWDHRAFLHWPATGLTVVPVSRYLWSEDGEAARLDGPRAGALALVADGDVLAPAGEHGADELVLHHADGVDGDERPAGHAVEIVRSIVTGDRLVTVSDRGIIVHDLATLADRGVLGF